MIDEYGANVSIDWRHHQVHEGKLHYANHKFTGVTESGGALVYVEVPQGVELHYNATYYSTTGGILDAYSEPVVSAIGTAVNITPYRANKPSTIKSKIYYTPTVTSNGNGPFRSIGVPGGTGRAGTGATGGIEQTVELVIGPGRYLLNLKPNADSSIVIIDAQLYETYD